MNGSPETILRTHTYDAANRLRETTITKQGPNDTQPVPQPSPTGKIEYNLAGQKRSETRKRTITVNGNPVNQDLITRYDYDPRGHMTRVTHPDGKFTESIFDAAGRMSQSIDRAGRITEHKYDGAGRLQETIRPDKTSTFTHYDAAGRVDWRRDARGKISSYQRTPGQEKVIYPRLDDQPASEPNQFVESLFDGAGNLTDSIDAKGHRTHYALDQLNRIREVWLYPAGGGTPIKQRATLHDHPVPTGSEYSGVVSATVEVDAALKRTLFGHDGLGRVKAVTLGFDTPTPTLDAASTIYSFDETGNLTTQKDAESRETKFEFDSLGRRTKRTLPGTPVLYEGFQYDDVGNMVEKTKFGGEVLTFEHDEMGRLLKKKLGDEVLAEFKYRADGQRAWMKYRMPDGQYEEVRYDYRGNRLWKKATEAGTIEYDWDEAGNLKRLAAVTSNPSASHVVTYDWNARGQLEKVWANGATTPTGCKYDEVGNLKEMLYPNDLQTVYGYNAQEHLTDVTVTQNGAERATFNYNPSDRPLGLDGMRRAAREIINGVTRNVDYYYDPLNRLTNETVNGAVIAYDGAPGYADTQGFDKVGNRGQRDSGVNGVSNQTYAYDARDRISGVTFDNNGNITGANGTTFEYDVEDRLIRRTGGGLSEVKLAYDGDGNRIRKTEIDGTVTMVTHYLVDEQNPTGYAQTLIEKQGTDPGTAGVTKSFVWGHRLISQSLAGTTHYFLHDGHGSTRALVNGTIITDTYDYDAFGILIKRKARRTSDGEMLEFGNPASDQAPSGTQAVDNAYRYVGEHFDPQVNLYYLRARWYDPNTGRLLQRDPWEGSPYSPHSLNPYTYAYNDPIDNSDPSGRETLVGVSVASSIGSSLQGIYNATVVGAGNAMQATLFGVQAGKGMNEILTGFILDETGIGLAVDAYQALKGYFVGDARGQRALDLAEFNLVFEVYILPWLMTADDDESFEVVDEIYTPQCLVAGTPVATPDGLQVIEAIRQGDLVWAWNDQKGERELKQVVHTFIVERNELVEIVVDDVRVVATPDHPFFTKDKRWKPAGQLVAGDALFDETNATGRVIHSVDRRQERCTVYNMEVEGLHNFFVTSAGILTHNVRYNHFFQNSFVRATGMKGLRYGKASLGKARGLSKAAHKVFHQEFNAYLEAINMRPGPGRSSRRIVRDLNLNFNQLVANFRPFFVNYPDPIKGAKWTKRFDEEVAALRAGLRTVP